MPDNQTPSEPPGSMVPGPRGDVQLLLGQIHGVLWLAVEEVSTWLLPSPAETEAPDLGADDLRGAGAEVDRHFGRIHAALNTGNYDEELASVGLSGAQGHAKQKGFLASLQRFFAAKREKTKRYLGNLRACLRWSGTLIRSITSALRKEIERVPGAASAGEAIGEFIELLLNLMEPKEDNRKSPENS